jgi:hypothetical protein
MDDRKQRLIADGGLPDGERFFGWEVADAAALTALAARLENAGVAVRRDPNDFMTSFYMRTPSEFLIEHGWGGREVGPGWQPVELKSVGSFWGHQGLFESLGEGPPPPDAPPMPAPEPNHAPLQVIEGNYERMSGVCPWWDAVKRNSRSIPA